MKYLTDNQIKAIIRIKAANKYLQKQGLYLQDCGSSIVICKNTEKEFEQIDSL